MPMETVMVDQEPPARDQPLGQENVAAGRAMPDITWLDSDSSSSRSSTELPANAPYHVPCSTDSQQHSASVMHAGANHAQGEILGEPITQHMNSSECPKLPESVETDVQLQAAVDHDQTPRAGPHTGQVSETTPGTKHIHHAQGVILEQQDCSQSNEEVERLKEQLKNKDEQLDIALGQLWGALDEIETLRQGTGENQHPESVHTDEPHAPTLPTHPVLHRVHQRLRRAMHGISQQITVETQSVDPPGLMSPKQRTPVAEPAAGMKAYVASTSSQEGPVAAPEWREHHHPAAPQGQSPTMAQDTPVTQHPCTVSVASCSQSITSPVEHDSRVVSPLPFCSPLVASPTDLNRASPSSQAHQTTGAGVNSSIQFAGDHGYAASPVLDSGHVNVAETNSATCAEVQTDSLGTESVSIKCSPSHAAVGTSTDHSKRFRDQKHRQGSELQCCTTVATQTATHGEEADSSSPCSAYCRLYATHGHPVPAAGVANLAQCPRIQSMLPPPAMDASHISLINEGGQVLHHGCCRNRCLPSEVVLCAQYEDQQSVAPSCQTETQYTHQYHPTPCMQNIMCASDGSLRSVQIENGCMSPAAARLLDPPPSRSPPISTHSLSPLQNEGILRTPGSRPTSIGALMHAPITYAGTPGMVGSPLYGYGQQTPSPAMYGRALPTRRDAYSSAVSLLQMPPYMHRWAPPSFQSSISIPDGSPNKGHIGMPQLGVPVSTSPKDSSSVNSDGSPGGRSNLNTYSVVGYNKFLARQADVSPQSTSMHHKSRVAFGSFLGP